MKILLYVFIITFSVKAQFISPYENINFDYSDNIQQPVSVGNFGFDALLNPYNPDFVKSKNHWFFQAGLVSNINQNSEWNDEQILKNKTKIYSNFICQYQNDWLGFQISYNNNIISSLESTGDKNWTFNFPPQYIFKRINISTLSTSIQFSSIFLVKKSITLNVGIIANNFETKFDFADFGSIEYLNKYFDNIQISAGINYSLDNSLKAYLNFKSSSNDNELKINPSLPSIDSPDLDHPSVYYNGLLALGIKYSVYDNLGLSIESNSDFNNYKSRYTTNYVGSGSIFNTKLIGGINYRPANNIIIGFSTSKYLEYKNPFFNNYEREIKSTPLSFNFATSYKFDNYYLLMLYQFSNISFEANGYDFTESEQSHYLGINVGIALN